MIRAIESTVNVVLIIQTGFGITARSWVTWYLQGQTYFNILEWIKNDFSTPYWNILDKSANYLLKWIVQQWRKRRHYLLVSFQDMPRRKKTQIFVGIALAHQANNSGSLPSAGLYLDTDFCRISYPSLSLLVRIKGTKTPVPVGNWL